MMLAAVSLLLGLLGASMAAPAPGYNMPETWEGQLSLTSAQSSSDYSTGIMAESTIHFDTKNSRIALQQEISLEDGKVIKVHVVQDLAKRKMYLIQMAAKQCSVVDLPTLLSGVQPQDDTIKNLGKRTMGWQSQTMEVNAFEITYSSIPMVLKQYQTDEGMPVMQQFRMIINNVKVIQGQVFSNIVKGIKDTSVFDVPSYCFTRPTPFDATNDVLNHLVAEQLALSTIHA